MQSVHGMSDKSCKCESCQAELNNEEQSVVDKHFKQPHKHRPHKCKLCTSSFTQVCYGTAKEQTIEAKVHLFSRCSLVSIPLKKQRKKKFVPSLLKCVESWKSHRDSGFNDIDWMTIYWSTLRVLLKINVWLKIQFGLSVILEYGAKCFVANFLLKSLFYFNFNTWFSKNKWEQNRLIWRQP